MLKNRFCLLSHVCTVTLAILTVILSSLFTCRIVLFDFCSSYMLHSQLFIREFVSYVRQKFEKIAAGLQGLNLKASGGQVIVKTVKSCLFAGHLSHSLQFSPTCEITFRNSTKYHHRRIIYGNFSSIYALHATRGATLHYRHRQLRLHLHSLDAPGLRYQFNALVSIYKRLQVELYDNCRPLQWSRSSNRSGLCVCLSVCCPNNNDRTKYILRVVVHLDTI